MHVATLLLLPLVTNMTYSGPCLLAACDSFHGEDTDFVGKSSVCLIAVTVSKPVLDMMQVTLSKQREAYRPLAVRGASLFFAMCDLQALSNMYRFSLTVLLHLFQKVGHDVLALCSDCDSCCRAWNQCIAAV